MRALSLVLVAALALGPAEAGEREITAEEMLDRLVGNSAVLTSPFDGSRIGVEHFPARDRSFIRLEGDSCVDGEVSVVSGLLCFSYEAYGGGLQCFVSLELEDGSLAAQSVQSGEVQIVEIVPGVAFDCIDGIMS